MTPLGEPFREVASALMIWTAQLWGHPVPAALPDIQFMAECPLNRQAMGDPSLPCPEDGDVMAEAFFSPARSAIVLPDDFDLSTQYGKLTLLHELTHWVQWQDRRWMRREMKGPCFRQRVEQQAYVAEMQWLEDHGVTDLLTAMAIDPGTLAAETYCGVHYAGQ